MPSLAQHQSATSTKMLLIGDSGSGKTGSLASLAKAGYNLWILDVDNGLDVLTNLLGDDTKALARVNFQTLTDKMKFTMVADSIQKTNSRKLVPVEAKVWTRSINMLMDWKDDPAGPSLGGLNSWGPQDILVIDSLTFLSTAALNHILAMNGRLGQQPAQSDWYHAQGLVEGLLQQLYSDEVKCNVIIMAHITYIGEDHALRGYPNTLGKALPPKVGRYFNSMLMARSQGQGTALKRKIITSVAGGIDLKNTAPTKVLPEYPLETGLADYFKAVRGPVTAVAA